MKKLLIHNYYKILDYKYHTSRNKKFISILKNVESEKGKLSNQLKKIADEYALDIFGSKLYAPCLYLYTATAGEFKEGWIPENYYARDVSPRISGLHGELSNLKSLHYRLFNSDNFPDIAYFTNGLFLDKQMNLLEEPKVINNLFKNSDKIVFKLDNSLRGRDIHFIEKVNFNLNIIKKIGNGVFQNYINQHSFFNLFNSSSVATIRITTVINDSGKAEVRGAYLRLARFSDTHVNSESNVRIAVDINTGNLSELGYLPNWNATKVHPDSNVSFKNLQIPMFENCKNTVLYLHSYYPLPRCIGWDVIINDKNDIIIMEWNSGKNDIRVHEAYQGPCFKGLGWENLWKKN